MNRLPDELDGGQANGWGHSVSYTQFLVFIIIFQYINARRVARQRPGSFGFKSIFALTRETLTLFAANNKGT